jgi:hypothetical protein
MCIKVNICYLKKISFVNNIWPKRGSIPNGVPYIRSNFHFIRIHIQINFFLIRQKLFYTRKIIPEGYTSKYTEGS